MRSWAEVAVLVIAAAGCTASTSEPPEQPGEWETLADRPCPDDSFVAYEDFGGPFVRTWCNGCHASDLEEGERQDATLGVDFDTIEDIRAEADRIWARAADHNTTMPPVGGPDEDERRLLGEWLACGAPSR